MLLSTLSWLRYSTKFPFASVTPEKKGRTNLPHIEGPLLRAKTELNLVRGRFAAPYKEVTYIPLVESDDCNVKSESGIVQYWKVDNCGVVETGKLSINESSFIF